jgi:SAM-dependent methyltransferase
MGECIVQIISSAIEVAQVLLKTALQRSMVIIDATAGNGNDTLFLAENSQPGAHIYAFDIQETALAAVREKTSNYMDKITCILADHKNITDFVKGRIDAGIFNLGYLPGGDHSLTTQPESTLQAIKNVLGQLCLHGVLAVVVYPGHLTGREEADKLDAYLQTISKKDYTVGCYRMINHADTAPFLYFIEKVRG